MLNWIDLLLLFLILSSILTGWYRGFIIGVMDLLRWVGSLLLGLRFYAGVAHWLSGVVDWNPAWLPPLAFFLVAFTASILIQVVENWVLRKLPPRLLTHKSNQVLGLIPGVFNGLVSATIVAVLLLSAPLPAGMQQQVQESAMADRMAAYTDKIEMALTPIFDEAVQQTLTKLTVQPGSEEMIQLPYTVAHSRPRPELETQMLELLNQERAEQGLKPLMLDTALTRVARAHSVDMFQRGYFSHSSPEGSTPFDRIRAARIPFRTAGENLALAPTLKIAHEGLMNSPGHRANILEPRFGRVGIGIMSGGVNRLMITQNFRN